jgi:hypothetical protein
MSTPIFEVDMEQGADFNCIINWYGGDVFRAPIEEIDPGYPTRVRVSNHLLPTVSDTPVIISGVHGAEMLNSTHTGVEECTYIDANYFYVPISTVGCEWVPGTGEITWHQPSDLTGYTGRLKLKPSWHSSTVIHEYTTENGDMVIVLNDASIQLLNTGVETAAFSFNKAYGDFELIAPGGGITRVARLIVTFSREMTS